MPAGGRRNRTGQVANENSGRSDRRGFSYQALPTSYDGPVPDFPLPDETFREHQVWTEAWTWPQANVWALPSERWMIRTVAEWVRLSVRCEDFEAPATVINAQIRKADQCGLTTAGLAEKGWKVATDELAAKAAERSAAAEDEPEDEAPPARRLRGA